MSKKLLIAVLSLMFCTFGIATADFGDPGQQDLDGVLIRSDRNAVNPDAPGFLEREKLDGMSAGYLQKPSKTAKVPVVFWPPDSYCDYNNTCAGYAYAWWCPTEWAEFYTRFSVDAEGYTATLMGVYILVDPSEFTGSPDLNVEIRDGDLSTVRHSVTVPNASLPTTAGYAYIDLSAVSGLDYDDGQTIAVVVVDPGGGNVIGLATDVGGHGGNAMLIGDGLGYIGWYGPDGYNLDFGIDLCYEDIPYSNCIQVDYLCEESEVMGWYIWSHWSLQSSYGYPKTHYFQQYVVDMPCTLKAIGIADFGDASIGYGSLSHGIDWMLCGDDGSGFPDTTDVYESGTIAWDAVVHTLNAGYGVGAPPNYSHVDLTTEVLVDHNSPFYLCWNISTTSIDPLADDSLGLFYWLSDEAECGYATKVGFNLLAHPDPLAPVGWMTTMDYYGMNLNWACYVDLCQDEFGVCKNFKNHCDDSYMWVGIPNSTGTRVGAYQEFDPIGLGCRVEKVYIRFGDATVADADDPLMYSVDPYLVFRDNDGAGRIGVALDSVILPMDFYQNGGVGNSIPPSYYDVDVSDMNIRFDGKLFVGISTPNSSATADGIYMRGDEPGIECASERAWVHYPPDFLRTVEAFGPPYTFNFIINIDVCCIPPPERDCELYVGGDWPTAGHDFRRTGASWNTTGDARCKQALKWEHHDLVDNLIYSRPVIYDGILVVAYNNKLQAFDIAASDSLGTSVLMWTIQGMPYIGTGMRNSVTVHNGYVYFGGGNAMSFNRASVYTGADVDTDGYGMDPTVPGSPPVDPTPLDPTAWSLNVAQGTGLDGNTTFTTSVILHDGSMDVLFVASEGGDLHALDAATGIHYAGWLDTLVNPDAVEANPVILDGPVIASLSSNGVDMLYVGTETGTLYAINAFDGTVEWTVYANTDLDGAEYDHADDASASDSAVVTHEYFQGPVSVDMIYGPGDIYVRTSFQYPNEVPGEPSGARYRLDADGNVIWSAGGRSYWQAGNASVSSPVIDANQVYFQAVPTWGGGSRQIFSYAKESGTELWSSDENFSGRAFLEGALDCRMLESDLYYHVNNAGSFLALETDEGMVEFDYTYDAATSNAGSGVAIDATHVIFTNYDGDIYCFTEGTVDVARLRILKTDELISVPFYSPNPFQVIYEDVFMNAGCANLTGTLEANEPTPSAIIVSSVNPHRMDRMMSVADQMIANSYHSMTKTVALDMNGYTDFDGSAYSKDSYSNMAAYAPPAWLIEIVNPDFDLADGDSYSIEYSVNGPLVTRGPHRCYVTIIPDNTNYFINNPTASPVIQLGVLGGCLEDGGDLTFGETSQNVVYFDNTGEFGNQDQTHMSIDDNSAAYWQGGLVVATSQYGLSFSLESWQGGDPADFWNTLLPEINCFDQCEPAIDGPVTLGYMWDGATYAAVDGYYAAAAFIDSALDYACDDGVTWDWTATECPFSNELTVGLRFDEYAYGVIGNAELNNVVVYRVDVTNRNSVAIADEVYFGNLSDWDLESNTSDVFFMDAAHSIMWGYSCAAVDFVDSLSVDTTTWVYGYGKIPMGMGDTRVRTLDANQAMWTADHVGLDSLYFYMSDPVYAGVTYQNGTDPVACMPSDDREGYFTFTSHTFDADEVFSFGYYVFGFNAADPRKTEKFTDLAALVNAWAGFNRGDIDADGVITLADNVALYNMVYNAGMGPLFQHTADVKDDGDGLVNAADVQRLADYWWDGVALDEGWVLLNPCPVGP
ncbi:MAG: PQQ-binding-like beta-propeller repeat protein [FCB group bacterium]|nr:PQQ-binding-like beta-propeller repeat protein [FCB group bacterium]